MDKLVMQYLSILNWKAAESYEKYPHLCPKFILEIGRKYIKVVQVGEHQRSVHSFINRKTGDLYKAAGWAAPVKDARYNLHDHMEHLKEHADIYGSYLYKNSYSLSQMAG